MSRRLFLALALAAAALPALAAPKPAPAAKPPAEAPKPSSAAPAAPVDLAYGAYQRGLYVTAYREALARAQRNPNDAAALTLLGELWNQGLAVKQDPKEAASWYRLAAARGSVHAMAALGMMALEGRGVDRDPRATREWLEKAAARREPMAAYNLALVLLSDGSEESIARAARLLVIATEGEIGAAQHALGVMHSRGQGGIAHDKAEAARMYRRAAHNGSTAGEVELAIVLFNGDGVAKNETLAARHFLHAAARGNAIAQNRLARLYAVGRGVPKNLVEALAWHTMARIQGLPDRWLDEQLKDVPADQRAVAERLADERANL